jgi:hypothetical protein
MVLAAAKHHWTTRVRPWTSPGNQRAGLLGQVEHHRRGLGHDEAVVVDDRCLAERADPAERIAVELAAGVIERVDAIRQPDLLERPLRPEVLRLAAPLGKDPSEAIERDHAVLPSESPGAPGPASQFVVAMTMTMIFIVGFLSRRRRRCGS